MALKTLVLLAAAQVVSAHFSLDYPIWRANTLVANTSYSQWIYPCGGVSGNAPNRTDWPVTGGSLKLDLHHPWTYVFVNLGLGDNVTNFNYTLTPNFWNETGNGTLCVPNLPLPINVTDGQTASIQVVTLGEQGNALYNCADITFRSSAKALNSSDCVTSPGVSFSVVNQQVNGSTVGGNSTGGSGSGSSNSTSGGGGKTGAGAVVGVSSLAFASAIGIAFVFAL